jgi:hypothetical protein
MQKAPMIISHALVEDFPHERMRKTIVYIEICDFEYFNGIERIKILEYLDKFLTWECFFKRLDLAKSLKIEDVASNTSEFEDKRFETG